MHTCTTHPLQLLAALSFVSLSGAAYGNSACLYDNTGTATVTLSGTNQNPRATFSGSRTSGCTDIETGEINPNYKAIAFYEGYTMAPGIKYKVVSPGHITVEIRDSLTLSFSSWGWANGMGMISGPDTWSGPGDTAYINVSEYTMTPSDIKDILSSLTATASPSAIAGNLVVDQRDLMYIYIAASSVYAPSPNTGKLPTHLRPTFVVSLGGSVSVSNNCTVTPSSITLDFDQLTPSMIKNKPRESLNLTVSCNSAVKLNTYINGEPAGPVQIPTTNPSVNASIAIDRNDFKMSAVKTGTVTVSALLFPNRDDRDIEPGMLSGVAYLDMRVD